MTCCLAGSSAAGEPYGCVATLFASPLIPLQGVHRKVIQTCGGMASWPAMNQSLSRDRAEGVIQYLMQSATFAPRHIVAPGAMGAMGVSDPVASNETANGRAENRRVENAPHQRGALRLCLISCPEQIAGPDTR